MSITGRVQRGAESLGDRLPGDLGTVAERYVRGWFEARRLRRADLAVVSFGKSGRTWVRVMLSRVWQRRHGLADGALIEFDDFHRHSVAVPRVLFTHDNYLGNYTGNRASKQDYAGTQVILLLRDPADIAVSQYFQWQHRMRPHKKRLNGYPTDECTMFEFVMGEAAGLPKIIRYLNDWLDAAPQVGTVLVVRYEDLRRDTAAQLQRMLKFVGADPTAAEVAEAVEYASLANMRQREARGDGDDGRGVPRSDRLRAADTTNPDSFKTRRGKVGGYRDYFSRAEIFAIDRVIRDQLHPAAGYGQRAEAAKPPLPEAAG